MTIMSPQQNLNLAQATHIKKLSASLLNICTLEEAKDKFEEILSSRRASINKTKQKVQ